MLFLSRLTRQVVDARNGEHVATLADDADAELVIRAARVVTAKRDAQPEADVGDLLCAAVADMGAPVTTFMAVTRGGKTVRVLPNPLGLAA